MWKLQELKIIGDLLASKYGPNYAECCRNESVDTISAKLKQKLSIQSPPKILVEKYVIEIAHAFNIPYEPDPQVMSTDTGINWMSPIIIIIFTDNLLLGKDALLIDLSQDNKNNLGGGGMPQPPGFLGYPQPPALPNFQMPPAPFSYPVSVCLLLLQWLL